MTSSHPQSRLCVNTKFSMYTLTSTVNHCLLFFPMCQSHSVSKMGIKNCFYSLNIMHLKKTSLPVQSGIHTKTHTSLQQQKPHCRYVHQGHQCSCFLMNWNFLWIKKEVFISLLTTAEDYYNLIWCYAAVNECCMMQLSWDVIVTHWKPNNILYGVYF